MGRAPRKRGRGRQRVPHRARSEPVSRSSWAWVYLAAVVVLGMGLGAGLLYWAGGLGGSDRAGGSSLPDSVGEGAGPIGGGQPVTPPVEPIPVPIVSDVETLKALVPRGVESETDALLQEEHALAEHLRDTFVDSLEAQVLWGDVLRWQGSLSEAIAVWKQVVAAAPQRVDVCERIASAAFEQEDYETVITYGLRALEAAPNRPGVHHEIGRALVRLKRYTEAIDHLQKELAIAPTAATYYLLGQVYQSLDQTDEAKAYYEGSLAADPNYTNAHYALARIYVKRKEPAKAKTYMEAFKRCSARDITEQKDRSRRFEEAVALRRELSKLYLEAERLYRERRDVAAGEYLLRRAVELGPDNVPAATQLAGLYRDMGRVAEAIAVLRRATEAKPKDAVAWLNLGILYRFEKRFGEAEAALRKAIRLRPDHHGGYQELARLYLMADVKLAEARALARRAVELGQDARSYFVLAWSCDANGDPAGALEAISKALELDPGNVTYQHLRAVLATSP